MPLCRFICHCLAGVLLLSTGIGATTQSGPGLPVGTPEAGELVRDAFNHLRGNASVAVVDMTIHRPDWERTMTIRGWTLGQDKSLFRILAPPKDKDNGTLKIGREMWTFNPKIQRVIKLPPSMMSQSWMGSDFSNNDLAKSDSLITDYVHEITGTEVHDGKVVYRVTSTPLPDAPVVWGLQKLTIREDLVFLSQEFYDEDGESVKRMVTREIGDLGGRPYPRVWRMQKSDADDAYTELVYRELRFEDTLPGRLFSIANLRSPAR